MREGRVFRRCTLAGSAVDGRVSGDERIGVMAHKGGLLCGHEPFRAIAPPAVKDPRWLVGLTLIGAPVIILLLRDFTLTSVVPILNVFFMPFAIVLAGEAGGDVEVDANGVRGGDTSDRMTWPFIDRVELADSRWWSPSTRVIGRYDNLITIPARMSVPGSDLHPAELVRREAEARGITVVGTRPVATLSQRFRGPAVLVILAIIVALVVPSPDAWTDLVPG